MAQIEAEHLSKTFRLYKHKTGVKGMMTNFFHRQYEYKEAVKDISFSVEEGEFVGFLGPNGAGKTTTLKMLSGILYPTSGEITVLGYHPYQRQNELKKQFSIIMGQKNQLWWDLPAMESFQLYRHMYGVEEKRFLDNVTYLAELLNVTEYLDVQVRNLSLGERMKLEIIASLLHEPKIIFLDEPTIGLDIIAQKNIRDFLKQYNKEKNATIVLTSHYMKDVEDLCDRLIVINKGSIVFDGTKEEVIPYADKKRIVEFSFYDTVAREELQKFGKIREYSGVKVSIETAKDAMNQTIEQVTRKHSIADVKIYDIPLEEGLQLLYEK